jgi:tetratricopeptide (TPR) repeat protein
MIADDTKQARREADIALKLSGMSIFWLDAVGYLLTLTGDWDRGPDLIRKALKINPFPRRACHSALWLDALRRNDPATALHSAREYAPETYFWGPLMEAVALIMNGRAEEAASSVQRMLQTKPDFPDLGHWLITRYVKFPALVTKIENALVQAGLDPSALR